MREVVCRYGVPLELHSDQGRNFESTVFAEMCSLLGIGKTRTTPYHPQSDGMVRRTAKQNLRDSALYLRGRPSERLGCIPTHVNDGI